MQTWLVLFSYLAGQFSYLPTLPLKNLWGLRVSALLIPVPTCESRFLSLLSIPSAIIVGQRIFTIYLIYHIENMGWKVEERQEACLAHAMQLKLHMPLSSEASP